jgi:hypothetical protein
MRRFLASCLGLVLLGAGCFGPDPNQTETGESLPVLAIDFPDVAEPDSVETMTLSIENPGPGDFSSVLVAFSRVGVAEGESLPEPIVDVVPKGELPAVVDIRPEPLTQADDIRFRFPALPQGDTMDIEFDLRIPTRGGIAANSVQVYDGGEPDRVRGVLLSTRVQ